jgi:hypothetical protein
MITHSLKVTKQEVYYSMLELRFDVGKKITINKQASNMLIIEINTTLTLGINKFPWLEISIALLYNIYIY